MKSLKSTPFSGTVLLLFLGTLSFGCNLSFVPGASTWQDVKSWKLYGERWAGGKDAKDKLIAFYDLSYPRITDQLHLGSINLDKTDFSSVAKEIKTRRAHLAEGSDQAKRADQALDILNHVQLRTNQAWWTEVQWKSSLSVLSTSEPKEFTLAQIDFAKGSKNSDLLLKALEKIGSAMDPIDGVAILGSDFLNSFKFKKQADGHYEITYTPSKETLFDVTRPKKLIDFMNKNEGLYLAVAWDAITTALGEAVGQIGGPISSGILSTALDRFFRFETMILRTRQHMALEMLRSANEERSSSRFSPFGDLTEQQRQDAIEYLVLADTSLDTVWYWMLHTPAEEWNFRTQNETLALQQSQLWFTSTHESWNPLNLRFATIPPITPVPKALSVLAFAEPYGNGQPYSAVDYGNPYGRRDSRTDTEMLSTLVDFGCGFIPYGGFIVYAIYHELVEKPIDNERYWDARLTSYLEARERLASENWIYELDVLYGQRVNPLELSEVDQNQMIENRMIKLGIHH